MAEKHPYIPGIGVDYTFSARLEIPKGQELNRDKVLDRLVQYVLKGTDPHLPIIGGIVGEGRSGAREEVLFGLDPSRSWGTPKTDTYAEFIEHIGQTEGWVHQAEDLPAVRVPLGRRREYDESNEVFGMDEVNELFRLPGRQALRLTAADLFSVRYIPGLNHPVAYKEPGVFVDISAEEFADGALEDVFLIAQQMDQDRLVPSITNVHTQVYNRGEK